MTNPYSKASWKQYKKSLTPKKTWQCIFIIIIALIGVDYFLPLWNTYIFETIICHINEGAILNIATLILCAYSSIKVTPKLKLGLLPSINSVFFFLTIVTIYIYYGRLNSTYNFYTFKDFHIPWLVNTDLLLLSCLSLLDFRAYNSPLIVKNQFSFIEDNAIVDKNKDSAHINSDGYVNTIINRINNSSTINSFAIGISGNWGSGKSYLLNLLYNALDNEDNIRIQFNVWRYNNTEGIIEDFFNAISSELKMYNTSISSKITDYSKKIIQPGKEIYFRLMDTIVNDLSDQDSIKSKYDKINTEIRLTGKRIIIFIDDLDRLGGTEIVSVLKLIRNAADFNNTFFIVAIDHEYVISTIKNTNIFSKEEQYLKKVFQLIVPLQKINKRNYVEEIRNLLGYSTMDYFDKDIIDSALKIVSSQDKILKQRGLPEGMLESMLDNIRDIKRFSNVIKLNFDLLKFDIDMSDYFLLVLIQLRNFKLYRLISDQILIKEDVSDTNFYCLNEEELKNSLDPKALTTQETILLEEVINLLLGKNQRKTEEVLINKDYFWIYFSFQLFNNISFRVFKETLEKSKEEIATTFNNWNNKYRYELIQILNNLRPVQNIEEAKKMLYAFSSIDDDKDHYIERSKDLIKSDGFWKLDNDDNVVEAIREIVNDDNLPVYSRASIVNSLNEIGEQRGNIIFNDNEIISTIQRLFEVYLKSGKAFDYNGKIEFLLKAGNINRAAQSKYDLNNEIARRYEDFLLNNKRAFVSFILYVIRSKSTPRPLSQTYVFNPFINDIFSNNQLDEITNWLNNIKEEELRSEITQEELAAFNTIKSIILKHADEYKNNREFIADKEEEEFLIPHLEKTGQIKKISTEEDDEPML
ncbi:P-loop NTPase fold protein [Chitinophaga sp. LS1]|uniref:KAP family P-loop NTPase fold protein n=1 Tax=Chitinophaga sp. LS1 TaxID=3051176 RepID=UPI002AAB638A|nr:P-loop NTPase fold protein [Chitinophaga sp. LS1]WPV68259.1 P-loop NTPase fold protein [Chitinophaga sp. LS1]